MLEHVLELAPAEEAVLVLVVFLEPGSAAAELGRRDLAVMVQVLAREAIVDPAVLGDQFLGDDPAVGVLIDETEISGRALELRGRERAVTVAVAGRHPIRRFLLDR